MKNQDTNLEPHKPARAHRDDPDYQDQVREFVRREVVQNVSILVSRFVGNDEEYLHMFSAFDADQARQLIDDELADDDERRAEIAEDGLDLDDIDDLKQVMGELGLDQCDAEREVFEHWIVTDWLGRQLEAQGECVERDFYGLTIWGRCTTGQAILLDDVICRIFDDLS